MFEIWTPHDAALGGHDRALAMANKGAAYQLFIDMRAVDIGGVEQGHANVERMMNDLDRHLIVTGAYVIAVRHAHAAKSNRPDLDTAAAKCARVHRSRLVGADLAAGKFNR